MYFLKQISYMHCSENTVKMLFYIIMYRFDFIIFNSYTEVCLSKNNTDGRNQERNDGSLRSQEAGLTTTQLCGLSHINFFFNKCFFKYF